MSQWYYAVDNEQLGPVPETELKQLLGTGQLSMETLVWNESMSEWSPANSVPYFAQAAATAPPPETPGALLDPLPGQMTAAAPKERRERDEGFYALSAGYAGFWKRFAAYFIDSIITGIAGFVLGLVIGIAFVASNPSGDAATGLQVASNLLGVLIGLVYYVAFESSTMQATPGKLALGIIVTDINGDRISILRATGRYFAKILSVLTLMIGFIMAGFTPKKQALHDMIAGTLVMNKS